MKKKNIITILAVIILVILIVFIVLFQDKKLDVTSKEVTELYKTLGEVDINKCGGLITYSDKAITANDLDINNRLCRAYYSLNDNQINTQVEKSSKTNSNGIKICKIGESTTLATTNENETECEYQIIEKSKLKESYKNIYGSDIEEEDKFYISDKEICIKEGEVYYCGNAENYNVSIAPDSTIYRIIDKAIEKTSGELIIYDYFLKISNNICYSTNTNNEVKECSNEIKKKDLTNDDEAIKIVKKYGSIYKHTFKKDSNKSHYWYKSELK